MKKTVVLSLPVLFAFVAFVSCKNTPEPKPETGPVPDTVRVNRVSTEGAVTFTITEGTVFWQGKQAIGEPHNGTIRISGGELLVNQGQVLSGTVDFDMGSMTVVNMKDNGSKTDLESHLKDQDFFDVKKFPSARFAITEVLPSNLPAFNWVARGDLTIKDRTHPVNVPLKMTITGDDLEAESASFIINRTKWGLSFRSGTLGTAKDKIIEDVIPISLKVRAKKK